MTSIICPKCSTDFVKRFTRRRLKDRLLSRIYVYFFKCQLCRYRFRVLQWGVRYPRDEEDRREYERFAVNFPISFIGETISGRGTVSNISTNGCAFVTDAQVSERSILRLTLQISNELPPVNIDAAVVRHFQHGRVGTEFLRIQQEERQRLQLLLRGFRRK